MKNNIITILILLCLISSAHSVPLVDSNGNTIPGFEKFKDAAFFHKHYPKDFDIADDSDRYLVCQKVVDAAFEDLSLWVAIGWLVDGVCTVRIFNIVKLKQIGTDNISEIENVALIASDFRGNTYDLSLTENKTKTYYNTYDSVLRNYKHAVSKVEQLVDNNGNNFLHTEFGSPTRLGENGTLVILAPFTSFLTFARVYSADWEGYAQEDIIYIQDNMTQKSIFAKL